MHQAPWPPQAESSPTGWIIPEPDSWVPPNRPYPGFGRALLLCLGFLLFTQVPGALVAVGLLTFFLLLNPDKFQGEMDPSVLLGSTEGSLAIAGAFLVAQIYVIGFSLLMLRYFFGRDWRRLVALRWPGWQACLLALASTPAFVFLGNLIYAGLRRAMPVSEEAVLPGVDVLAQLFQSWPALFGVLVIGFGPGIGEELWCRGFLGRGLVGRYGPWVGVLLTSFLFGLIHIEPCQGTMAMIMGLWLHYVYLTTRSLWMPMLLHTVNNSLAVLAVRFAPLEQVNEAAAALPEAPWLHQLLSVGSALILLLVVGWALYRSRARIVGPAEGPTWQPPFPSVESPPETSPSRVVPGRLSWAGSFLVLLAFLVCVASLAGLVSSR